MVFGFVKQSDGHVKAYSEVGHGTTIKLYLPPASGQAEAARPRLRVVRYRTTLVLSTIGWNRHGFNGAKRVSKSCISSGSVVSNSRRIGTPTRFSS